MGSTFDFKEVKFYQQLQPYFEDEGFRLVPELKQFRRNFEGGFQNIVISPVQYQDVIYFEVTFGTRFHVVEEVLNFIENKRGFFAKHRNTTLTTLGQYLEERYFRLKAHNQPQIREAGEYLESFFKTTGLDFLNQLSDLNLVESSYNENPAADSPLVINQELRCFRGLIMAYITQNRNLDNLQQHYTEHLLRKNAPADRLSNFSMLGDYLNNFGLS